MKNPNGYGSVVKLRGAKRRNPFKPRKTIGFLANNSPIYLPGLPAFSNQPEAEIFLATYNKDVAQEDSGMNIKKSDLPKAINKFKELKNQNKEFRISPFLPSNIIDDFKPTINNNTNINNIENCANALLVNNNISTNDMSDFTVEQVYGAWSKEVFPSKEEIYKEKEFKQKTRGKLSSGNMRAMKNAYNYLSPIYNIKYKNVTSDDLQSIIDNCDKSDSILSSIINLMRKLDKYAARKKIITIKQSDDVTVEYRKNRESKVPFTNAQIHKIWSKEGLLWADITLFLLYTGMRIEECFDVRTVDVHLDDYYLRGGIKTQAGIDRVIPIHNAIKYIIKRYYNPNNKYLFTYNGKKLNKATFYNYYYIMLDELGIPHIVPHTTRTTFRSELDRKCEKLNQKTCIDKIMGHITNDTGTDVYTKKDLEDLLSTINCLTYDVNEEQHYIVPTKYKQEYSEKINIDKKPEEKALADFEANIKEINKYKRFLKKINKNYEKAKTFDELQLVEIIASYNEYLTTLSFNKDYFFKCRDSIDKLYQYYYKHYILKTLKNKSSQDILSALENNVKRVYTYKQVRKTLTLIIYYDTLLNYYNQLSEEDKLKIIFALNRIIQHYTNFYKRIIVTKYKCNVSIQIDNNFDLSELESDGFKNDEGYYKSPDNSIWINTKTKQVEDMSICSENGLYEVWIKKFEQSNILHYIVA